MNQEDYEAPRILCGLCQKRHIPSQYSYRGKIYLPHCEGGSGWTTEDVPFFEFIDCGDWKQGEIDLIDHLLRLGYPAESIMHYSRKNKYAPWDVTLFDLVHKCVICRLDAKTPVRNTEFITINETPYERAKRYPLPIYAYNSRNGTAGVLVDAVEECNGRPPIFSPGQEGEPYVRCPFQWPGWKPLEDVLMQV